MLMRSLRSRFTLLTVCAIAIAIAVVTLQCVAFIRSSEKAESEQLLLLLCETGKRNLDYYFEDVQKSVGEIAAHVEQDLNGLDDESLRKHVDRMEQYFDDTVHRTDGVLTYYYRINPEISGAVKGFWYTDANKKGFEKHEITDISLYDTNDTSNLVWFTVPKNTGEPVWLPPYVTENLDARVISYNVPVYWKGQFVGVVGMEIDCSTMAEQVDSIKLYDNGYAFLNDDEGNIFYHPRINIAQLGEEDMPVAPDELGGTSTFLHYTYDGIEKHAVWLPLKNGMRLTVAVPVSETNGDWAKLIGSIVLASILVLALLSLFTSLYTRRITKPLEDLTAAAEQANAGNYDFDLDYDGDDEIGRLTTTFKVLTNHMKSHIDELSKRVYVDALTSAKNRRAFADAIDALQAHMNDEETPLEFAIGVFDCDNLKLINDQYGHEKGDVYLKTACHLICKVFQHSPVFRTGGDEFAVIMQGQDFENRDALVERFDKMNEEINLSAMNEWEQAHITKGLATFDPHVDHFVIDTVRRADSTMYANKRKRKGLAPE